MRLKRLLRSSTMRCFWLLLSFMASCKGRQLWVHISAKLQESVCLLQDAPVVMCAMTLSSFKMLYLLSSADRSVPLHDLPLFSIAESMSRSQVFTKHLAQRAAASGGVCFLNSHVNSATRFGSCMVS